MMTATSTFDNDENERDTHEIAVTKVDGYQSAVPVEKAVSWGPVEIQPIESWRDLSEGD